MTPTLKIDDDDACEVVRALERSFEIGISEAEAAVLFTLGDVFDFLKVRFAEKGRDGTSCGTAMAFYRLRRAFAAMAPDAVLRPSIRLTGITSLSARRLFRAIEKQSGLRLPRPDKSWIGILGAATLLGIPCCIPIGLACGYLAGIGTFALVFFGGLLQRLDPGRIPGNCQTLGDLSKRVSALNFGRLVNIGAQAREPALWSALTEIVAPYTAVSSAEMRPEALMLRPPGDRA